MPNGARQLREVARDLKAAGSPRGLRKDLRADIVAAMQPMRESAKSNAESIPAKGPASTGLRAAIARSIKTRIALGVTVTRVRLIADGKLMPAGQQSLTTLMEGKKKWRHPEWGHEPWVDQESHPYMAPAVAQHLPGAAAADNRAAAKTAAKLSRGQ